MLIKVNLFKVDDGVDFESNIRDVCYGKEVKCLRQYIVLGCNEYSIV